MSLKIKPLGTLGAVSLIEEFKHEHVLVTNSDILTNLDYEDFYLTFLKSGADMAVVTIPYKVDIPYAVLETSNGHIMNLKEKPSYTYYSNGGIYLMKQDVLNKIPKNAFYNTTDLIEDLIAEGCKVYSYPLNGYWLDIGKHEDYEKAKKDIHYLKILMNPLVVIPARGGSKRLLNKNILPLGDKPLILHTVDFARRHFDDNRICVSTDDSRIKNIVESTGLGVPFLRPEILATDTASTSDVLIHASSYFEEELSVTHDVIILMQPTTPFRLDTHLFEGLNLIDDDSNLDMVVSVCETKANPYFVLFEENELGYLEKSKKGNFTRSQDAPKVWEYNGSLYFINKESLMSKSMVEFTKVKKLVMHELYSIDIDTELDFEFAKYLIEKKKF
jgi:CMP-N,N'-diacetyllegionaminic acid synthase